MKCASNATYGENVTSFWMVRAPGCTSLSGGLLLRFGASAILHISVRRHDQYITICDATNHHADAHASNVRAPTVVNMRINRTGGVFADESAYDIFVYGYL